MRVEGWAWVLVVGVGLLTPTLAGRRAVEAPMETPRGLFEAPARAPMDITHHNASSGREASLDELDDLLSSLDSTVAIKRQSMCPYQPCPNLPCQPNFPCQSNIPCPINPPQPPIIPVLPPTRPPIPQPCVTPPCPEPPPCPPSNCPTSPCPPGPPGMPGNPGPPCVGPPGNPGPQGTGYPGPPGPIGPPGVCYGSCQQPQECNNDQLINQIISIIGGTGCCSQNCPTQTQCPWDIEVLVAKYMVVRDQIDLIDKLDTRIDLLVAAIFKMRLAVEQVYDMVGEPGSPGDDGEPGEKGDKGPAGEPGQCPGSSCLVGSPGDMGPPGSPGDQGRKGECCYGAQGRNGRKGAAGRGILGERGPPGFKGDRGDPGRAIWGYESELSSTFSLSESSISSGTSSLSSISSDSTDASSGTSSDV